MVLHIKHKMTHVVFILFLSLNSIFITDNCFAAIPYCTAKQLTIYLIGIDTPGMSKVRTLHGIINTSKQACRLSNDNNSASLKIADRSIVIESSANADSISSDKLVWFSIDATTAVAHPPFKTTKIKLPGIAQSYSVKLGSLVTGLGNISAIQKNAAKWHILKEGDSCDSFKGKTWSVYFNKPAQCG